tara:strand:+ start:373 stop:669 length:297 start_codon:yes stop_codon:yes gene_type:complete
MDMCNRCGRELPPGEMHPICRHCGYVEPRNNEGDLAGVIFLLIAAVFLLPAVLTVWPFVANLEAAFKTVFFSYWGWGGSLLFWLFLAALIYRGNSDEH